MCPPAQVHALVVASTAKRRAAADALVAVLAARPGGWREVVELGGGPAVTAVCRAGAEVPAAAAGFVEAASNPHWQEILVGYDGAVGELWGLQLLPAHPTAAVAAGLPPLAEATSPIAVMTAGMLLVAVDLVSACHGLAEQPLHALLAHLSCLAKQKPVSSLAHANSQLAAAGRRCRRPAAAERQRLSRLLFMEPPAEPAGSPAPPPTFAALAAATDKRGWTAAHHAVAVGQVDCLRALARHGGPAACHHPGRAPLQRGDALLLAVRRGETACVAVLLHTASGLRGTRGVAAAAAAAAAGHGEILRLLHEAGADLTAPSGDSRAWPAHRAAEAGHTACIAVIAELTGALSHTQLRQSAVSPSHFSRCFGGKGERVSADYTEPGIAQVSLGSAGSITTGTLRCIPQPPTALARRSQVLALT